MMMMIIIITSRIDDDDIQRIDVLAPPRRGLTVRTLYAHVRSEGVFPHRGVPRPSEVER